MEDELDLISKGEKEYQDLCRQCLHAIDSSIPKKTESQENVSIKSNIEIQIDDNHSYVIAKYGPAIKYKDGEKISFKSVKKHIDIDKLKNGDYKLEDIIEIDYKKLNSIIGKNLQIKNIKIC